MNQLTAMLLLVLPMTAFGQDSVSRNANGGNGLPGDGIAPWAATYARQSFVLDLSPIEGSWGTPFGVGPVLKAARINSARFSAYSIAPTISPLARSGASYPAASYKLWTQAGGGLHLTENDQSLVSTVSPAGSPTVFGVAMLDVDETLSGTTLYLANILHGAQVAFDPAVPDRLYITRVVGAQNASSPSQPDRSQFGIGGVDADGNLVFRADSFGSAGPSGNLLPGDNFFRVRLPARGTSVNLIDSAGASNSAATDWIVQNSAITHAVPTLLPASLAGVSRLIAADFAGLLRVETSPSSTTTTAGHRPGSIDHRGSAAVSPVSIFAGSVASSGILTRSTGSSGKADSISVFGLSTSGAISGAATLTVPTAVIDACNAFSWPISGGAFRGYDSQMLFRGPSGSVVVGRDAQGRGLAAGVLYAGAVPDPAQATNALAVVRFDPSNPEGTAQWTLAAWTDAPGMQGKDILGDFGADGAPGSGDVGENDGHVNALDAPIGRLAGLNESSLGFAGPSISSPGMDSAGNIYFLASCLLKRWTGTMVVQEPNVGVFRAVYDPATMCYRLELLLKVGDVIAGRNSARNYRVAGLYLADSDSISSGAPAGASVAGAAWNNLDPATLQPASPQTLGGLVLVARISYDVNQDGQFEDLTLPGSNSASVDEAYNVLLYVGNITPPGPACDADVNCDGSADGFDVEVMERAVGGDLSDFCQADPDFNRDGSVDGFDVEAVEQVVAGGSCP
jgi:hypothetical protein